MGPLGTIFLIPPKRLMLFRIGNSNFPSSTMSDKKGYVSSQQNETCLMRHMSFLERLRASRRKARRFRAGAPLRGELPPERATVASGVLEALGAVETCFHGIPRFECDAIACERPVMREYGVVGLPDEEEW